MCIRQTFLYWMQALADTTDAFDSDHVLSFDGVEGADAGVDRAVEKRAVRVDGADHDGAGATTTFSAA
jgi:hypothetical protein